MTSTSTSSPQAPVPCSSDFDCTNEALYNIYLFLFGGNSIMTWLLLGILVIAFFLNWWLRCIKCVDFVTCSTIKCARFSGDMLAEIKGSSAQFLAAYAIGIVMFAIGIWLEATGQSGIMVQLMSFSPAIILAVIQLKSIYGSAKNIKQYLGV